MRNSVALLALGAGLLGCGTEPEVCPAAPCSDGGSSVVHPVLAPDALLFASDRSGAGDIYAIRTDGTGLEQVTAHPDPERGPSISNDRTRVAFHRRRTEFRYTQGWVLGLAAGDSLELPTGGDNVVYPIAWAPHDRSVAFLVSPSHSGISRTGIRAVAAGGIDGSVGNSFSGTPRWMPAGDSLLIDYRRMAGGGPLELWHAATRFCQTCDPGCWNGSCPGARILARVVTDDPTVAPDGRSIAVVREDTMWRISVADTASQVLAGPVNGAVPTVLRWSPTGEWIAFVAGGDVYVIRPDGSQLRNVSTHAAPDAEPAWAPDGARLAFTSERDGNKEIYVVGVDGTGLRNLTNSPAMDEQPNWSPIR
jgi:hypothetical protein